MKKGFTLLELIVVIIIIGVLATLGFTQYQNVVERSRTAEARSILGTVRTAQVAYNLENGAYGTLANLPLGLPGGTTGVCTNANYWYEFETSNVTGTSTAHRCSAGGKTPNAAATCTVTLSIAGVFGGTCP